MTDYDPIDRLRERWLAERPPGEIRLPDLRAEAARRRRRLTLVVLMEAVMTIGLVLLTISVLRREEPLAPGMGVWLALAWGTWATAVAFAVWNRRGAWAVVPGRSHIDQVARFARMRVRTASFVLLATLALIAALLSLGMASTPVIVVAGLYVVWALWYGHRARREHAAIRRIAAEFAEEQDSVL